MPAHQIKGVAQLAARGIGGVMRKGVLVVVDHQSARGAAADERISVVLFRSRITVREDMRQHIGNGMRPAECADDPALFSRIFLFAGSVPDALLHRLCRRPERGVPPVGIGFQHFIRIEKRRVLTMKKELAVLGRAGPVHEPRRFEGGGIEAQKPQIICYAAGHRGILVRRDRACQRDNEPQAHLFRSVTVGRIKRVGVDERHVQIVHEAGIGVVRVQAQHTAIDHAGVVAFPVFKISADEAAHVFDRIALAFGHGSVLSHRLPSAGRGSELVQKLAPEHLFVLPLGRFPAPANGDQELAVVLYLHSESSSFFSNRKFMIFDSKRIRTHPPAAADFPPSPAQSP